MRLIVVQSDPFAGPGVLESPLRLRGVQLRFVFPFLGDEVPLDPGDADGVIVLGGQAMPDADDEFPFLEPTRALLRRALAQDVPVLGVCLGAELLCQAAGGGVRRLDGMKVGWIALERGADAAGDPLFGDLEEGHQAFAYHSFALVPPPGAAILDRLRTESARRQAASQAFGEELAHRFADQVLRRRTARPAAARAA